MSQIKLIIFSLPIGLSDYNCSYRLENSPKNDVIIHSIDADELCGVMGLSVRTEAYFW